MIDTGVRVLTEDGLFHVALNMGDGKFQAVTMNLDGSSKGGTLEEIAPTLLTWLELAAKPAYLTKITLGEEAAK